MKYLVTVRLEFEGNSLEWAEQEVEAVDKWGALVGAVESIGVDTMAPMSSFWPKSRIIKKERSEVRKWRRKT